MIITYKNEKFVQPNGYAKLTHAMMYKTNKIVLNNKMFGNKSLSLRTSVATFLAL